jgi:hypothetical protein
MAPILSIQRVQLCGYRAWSLQVRRVGIYRRTLLEALTQIPRLLSIQLKIARYK